MSKTVMKNMMKVYLGDEYSNDHLKNFCLYWMKAGEGSGDEWRKKNDLDCLYFDGDLRADTLMSAWTPVKWVVDCLNREYGMKFYKKAKDKDDPNHYLKLLANDRDAYLPSNAELTQLLDRFLELAELRCNYILLPDRAMNPARYRSVIDGEEKWLFDEVPVMLCHIFDENWFGKYFKKYSDSEMSLESKELPPLDQVEWIKQECLECGFESGIIGKEHVRPLIKGLPADEAKWMTEEEEIREALEYMIMFLEARQSVFEKRYRIMKIDDKDRPEEITSDEIWELYKRFECLDQKYVFYDRCDAPHDKEELFYVVMTEIGDDGIVYEAPDNMGLQLPYSKNEWVELSLENITNGRKQKETVRIRVNTLSKKRLSVDELLRINHIRIPADEDLKDCEYEAVSYGTSTNAIMEKIPVVHIPVPVNTYYTKGVTEAETAAYNMERYLKYCSIPYKIDKDRGAPRISFFFMCENAPGGFTEGKIWFFNKAAEARVYYNRMGADICKRSDHREELFRLLNFINARVFMELSDGGDRWYDPQILYTPRMHLTEDGECDISITTMINYRFLHEARFETQDYITTYQPELLDKLAPFIFGTLRGDMTADAAISGIKSDLLNGAD